MKLNDFATPYLYIHEAPEMGPLQDMGLKDPSILNHLKPTGDNIEGNDLHALRSGNEYIFAIKDKKK